MRPGVKEPKGGGLLDEGGRDVVGCRRRTFSSSSERVPFGPALGSTSTRWPWAHCFVAVPGDGASLTAREARGESALVECVNELARRARGRVAGV